MSGSFWRGPKHAADVTVALIGANFGWRPASAAAWLAQLAETAETAAQSGTDILVLPEYISLQWLAFAPAYKGELEASGRQAAIAQDFIPAIRALAKRLDMTVIFGTTPVAEDSGHFQNRCHVLFPEGDMAFLDKLCLTPPEKMEMGITPGNTLPVFDWRGLRFAVLICLDCELPGLAARLAPLGIDLLIVPSQTSTAAGYYRVFSCARARAIELACPVAVVGGIGTCHFPSGNTEPNVSGAACYLPCESALVENGIHSETGPFAAVEAPQGLLHIARNIPIAAYRALREGKQGDVWPGAWQADGVNISEQQIAEPVAGRAA